jgi:sugar phosphate permease
MEKHDTSKRSPSDQEKHVEGTHEDRLNKEIPDPDAHLSDAERAAIVSPQAYNVFQSLRQAILNLAKFDQDRKLVRKLDRIIIPWLCLLYLASFLDRTNIGNAKIDGLQKDLKMTSNQYNLTLTIFFISYSVFEPATQIMLKKFRPSIFLPIIMILWGIVMTTMGLVHNFSGLMAARWFLGITEAGLFPGVNYYLSAWYRRRELGIRAAVFFSAAALAGSFGGLLAAAISESILLDFMEHADTF